MLDSRDITVIKDANEGHKLIYVHLGTEEYLFRDISLKEYQYISKVYLDKNDRNDVICSLACLYPEEEIDFTYFHNAHLPDIAAEAIIKYSGVENQLYAMEVYTEFKNYTSLELQCMDLIKAFIQDYTYDDMKDWTYDRLMYMTVRAEKIAELKGYDWHLEDTTELYKEKLKEANILNDEYNTKLIENGMDPIMHHGDYIKELFDYYKDQNFPNKPVISANRWNDEVMLDAIRKQSHPEIVAL